MPGEHIKFFRRGALAHTHPPLTRSSSPAYRPYDYFRPSITICHTGHRKSSAITRTKGCMCAPPQSGFWRLLSLFACRQSRMDPIIFVWMGWSSFHQADRFCSGCSFGLEACVRSLKWVKNTNSVTAQERSIKLTPASTLTKLVTARESYFIEWQ